MSVVRCVAMTDDGEYGTELAQAHLEGAGVTYYGLRPEILQMQLGTLARMYHRTEAEMVTTLAREGWSNGKISIIGTGE